MQPQLMTPNKRKLL